MKAVLPTKNDIAEAFENGLEAVEALVVRQNTFVLQLIERIEKLENQQSKNSGNSGKPPSSDGLKKPVPPPAVCDKTAVAKAAGNPGAGATGLSRLKKLTKRSYTQCAIVSNAVHCRNPYRAASGF